MAKFLIECPECGMIHKVSDGFFAKKTVYCECGLKFNIKDERFVVKTCAHCGNTVVFDSKKGTKAKCPVCKERIVEEDYLLKSIEISCPSCESKLLVDKNAQVEICPLCDTVIDVQYEIEKEKVKSKGNANLIECKDLGNNLVYKHPITEFNKGSQIIVRETQEALLIKNGDIYEVFQSGKHEIVDRNSVDVEDGNKYGAILRSEIYFINKLPQTNIKWGTDSRVRIIEPKSRMAIEIGACGEFSIRVLNSKVFFSKLVGLQGIDTDYETKAVVSKIKALIISKVKSAIARTIKELNVDVFEIDLYIEQLSESIKEDINQSIVEYGLRLEQFIISNVMLPEEDPNFRKMREQFAQDYLLTKEEQIKLNVVSASQQRKVLEAQISAQEEIIKAQAQAEAYRLKAQAEAQEMQMKGYTYQDETDRLEKTKPTFPNMGFNVNVSIPTNPVWDCKNCGRKGIVFNFCPDCGAKRES